MMIHSTIRQRTSRIALIALLWMVIANVAAAQDVTVSASVDSPSVRLGDWIRYSVVVKHPVSVSVTFPAVHDTLGHFEVVRQDSLVRTEHDGVVEVRKDIIVSKYEPGTFSLPPYRVEYFTASGRKESAAANPIPVEIRGIEIDTSQTIKDVKPPLTVPMSAEEIALYAAVVLALAGLGYGVYYYLKKRKRVDVTIEDEKRPAIPPDVLALLQLDELETKRLWQAGEVKAYYSEATEIIRRYFELRYGIMALEMTSGEVMDQLGTFSLSQETKNQIHRFLSSADLVKFAKYLPVAAENEEVIPAARRIVESTKPVSSIVNGNTSGSALTVSDQQGAVVS